MRTIPHPSHKLPLFYLLQHEAMGKTQLGTGEQRQGRVNRTLGLALCDSLCLHSSFHGDFISSKLLIKFHIYDQKIKSLGLSEIGFYEFGLRQLSQQRRACRYLDSQFQSGNK